MNIRKLLFIGLHLLFGFGCHYLPVVSTIWIYFFLAYSIDRIIRYKNSDEWAGIAAGYMVGIEVLLRMTHTLIFYEAGKYIVVCLLILGFIVEKYKHKIPTPPIMYLILLLPSIAMVSGSLSIMRDFVSFNLSGPLCLCISAIYFYRRKYSLEKIENLFFSIVLPLLSMVINIMLKMPNLSKLAYNLSSNKSLSGGFGPNQVSTILGFVFLLVGIAWILKFSFSVNSLTDRMIGVVCTGYALLTFSRGGVIVPTLVLLIAFLITAMESKNLQQFFRIILIILFIGISGYFLWGYLNSITGKSLGGRYEKTVRKTDISQLNEGDQANEDVKLNVSGRDVIFFADLDIFANNPIMGVGPGMAQKLRLKKVGIAIGAHTEFSRMLAEHGLYGIGALLIMIFYPFSSYRKKNTLDGKVFTISFTLFCLLTSTHAAMRLALPGFSYGMAFIIIERQKKVLESKVLIDHPTDFE